MVLPTWKRGIAIAAGIAALYVLYGFGLDRVGMLSTDEPRYAAVGRAMADSGDWITPRLWGHPWFEKPALLYWMTALAFKAGLDPDLAPRVPVALISVAFLVFFCLLLRRELGALPALYATSILGTSAGWLTYSHVAVTDLPLAVCFSVTMLLLLPGSTQPRPLWAGVFLGLAVLAKGLVPLVLILPALWFLRKRWSDAAVLIGVALAVAAPWYALVIVRNGQPFVAEFFWKQHFARFVNASLQHVRPVWFYIPVLLGGLFPWTPLLALLFHRSFYGDRRVRFLAAWAVFGFLFFSMAENKLPGYLLPLLPAVAALLGQRLAQTGQAAWALASSAALLWLIPEVADVLPTAISNGALNGASHISAMPPVGLIAAGLTTGLAIFWVCAKAMRTQTVAAIASGVMLAAIYLIITTFPELDRTVSARQFSRTHPVPACVDSATRSWRYGLSYYAHREVPECDSER